MESMQVDGSITGRLRGVLRQVASAGGGVPGSLDVALLNYRANRMRFAGYVVGLITAIVAAVGIGNIHFNLSVNVNSPTVKHVEYAPVVQCCQPHCEGLELRST
ncbi:hypothetical protein ABZ208_31880 [Streptomyces sp. NPDC006208]|uniref:hypothetical protein n=1 Tax=Streptomyces sp. NPDC006208 TaxID=3156734 RepID=UPI0033B25FFE